MRRVNSIAALSRAIAGRAGASSAAMPRPVQSAVLSKFSALNAQCFSPRFADHLRLSSPLLSGNMFSSVAASSIREERQAKEPSLAFNRLPKNLVLYQYEACPFCNKIKAFLDYYNIPYKVVEVNPISKKEIRWSDYKKVPILTVDGEQMVKSSDIITNFFQMMHRDNSIPHNDEETKWRRWVDDRLVHILSPNIYRNGSEALESFGYITTHGNFNAIERLVGKYTGAAAMYFVSKKLKKKHNITDERAALYHAAETWVDALKGRKFLGLFDT
uniref:Prostaglandin E synthase 2 n=1 Tax=Rhizophora mucronata TaxID=61149 RepID=A0A2P2JTB2_RHIMU